MKKNLIALALLASVTTAFGQTQTVATNYKAPDAVLLPAPTLAVGLNSPPPTFNLAVTSLTKPQATNSPFSHWFGSFYHDWHTGTWSAVVVNTIGQFTIGGKPVTLLGCNLTYDAFAGAELKSNAPAVAGVGFGLHKQVFDQVFAFADFAVSVSGDHPIGFGGLVGFGISFGS